MLICHPLDTIFEFVWRNPQGTARFRRAFGDFVKLVRYQAGHEHAVARHGNEPGDVDTHRADQRAAPADRAAVVQQVLPFLELVDGDFLLEAEQAIEERERPCLALVGLLEQLELPDRRVPRIIGAHMEVAGIRTHAAMETAIEIGGRLRVEVLDEMMHCFFNALFRLHVTLDIVTNLGRLVGQPFGFTIEWMSAVNSGHVFAPLRSNTIPVVPLVTNTRNV